MLKRTLLLAAVTALAVIAPASGASTATITISHQMRGCHMWQLGNAKPTPTLSVTLKAGTVLRFVNNDVRAHNMTSDPHPEHTDCPELNSVGLLQPGQSRESGNLNIVRTCGFQDHDDPPPAGGHQIRCAGLSARDKTDVAAANTFQIAVSCRLVEHLE